MRSKGMSYRRCASMTSRPLLTRVAEFTVMTGPIAQVGCASASAGVTFARSAFVRPRKGPPDAVTTSLRTSARVPAASAWKSAACSESTGMIWPGLASALTSGPPTISDSLLASASVWPASRAARVGARPIDPVMPLRTVWQCAESVAATCVAASGPATISGSGSPVPYSSRRASRRAGTTSSRATATVRTRSCLACSARRPTRPPAADRAVTRKRSGLRSTRSMAWVPIEPVEPRMTMSRGPSVPTGSKTRCGSARGAGLSLMPPLWPHPAPDPTAPLGSRRAGAGRVGLAGAPQSRPFPETGAPPQTPLLKRRRG
ncbi:hypothetical protein SMD44_06300 [Streptomyces alboflavus]|uniref:Uncharacterized protein n=1 Tax=Streptomyces alboflavus TaxID=67267 RepID=A0A1Z1WK52_9ACTN|nr:hypothetical protein SMD44_06300 [Streptomyces alboflavus]